MTTIKPVLKYPGAKWRIADWITSYFPKHTHYVEPFFGSGAVFFNKQPAKHEVINDLSGDVVNLFRVIRERGEELAAQIEMTPWAREEYELSYASCDDALERARRFVVRTQQGHGTDWVKGGSTWSHSPVRTAITSHGDRFRIPFWQQTPDRIRALTARLLNTEIEHDEAIAVICRYAARDVLIYADPPYVTDTRTAKLYQHEMGDADHVALLDALDAHPGPVVLSGYACDLYDDRLLHWRRVTKEAQAEKGNTRTEVLWLNPVCVDRLGYGPLFEQEAA